MGTLKATFFALKSFLKNKINQVICLKLDNTTAVAYLNNMGGTHCSQLLRLTLEIWEWCEKKSVCISSRPTYSRSKQYGSRCRVPSYKGLERLESEVRRDLPTNNRMPNRPICITPVPPARQIYVSWRPDLNALYTDALTISWSNMTAYAFPPFNLIHAVLHKARAENAILVLVAPLWSAQPWWPLLIGMLIDYPVYLRNNKELLTDMSNPGTFYPLFPTLKLAVWKVSGDSSRQLAFQTQLSNSCQTALRLQPPSHATAHGLSRVAGVINGKVIPYFVQSTKS